MNLSRLLPVINFKRKKERVLVSPRMSEEVAAVMNLKIMVSS